MASFELVAEAFGRFLRSAVLEGSTVVGAGAVTGLVWGARWARSRRPIRRLFHPALGGFAHRGDGGVRIVVPYLMKEEGEGRVVERSSGVRVSHPGLPVVDLLDMRAASACREILMEAGVGRCPIVTTHDVPTGPMRSEGARAGWVFVGAGSNPHTMRAQREDRALYRFENPGDVAGEYVPEEAVIKAEAGESQWARTTTHDYAVIQRFGIPEGMVMILAGLGAIGTAAAGIYLQRYWRAFAGLFGTSDFGVILKVERSRDPRTIGRMSVVHASRWRSSRVVAEDPPPRLEPYASPFG